MNMLLSKAITLVIVLTHFVSFGAAGAAHRGTVATPDAPVPVPHYCSEIEDGIDTASALQRQLICGALRSLHRGDLQSAINGLDAAGSIRLHEAPNTRAFSFLAAALHGKGEIERAESAPDTAYVLILIDMGVLVCDVREDFRVARDPRTDGLDETVLENAGARMCGPMFATPDFWKKSPAGERALSRAVEEFEWARSRTKLGRPRP